MRNPRSGRLVYIDRFIHFLRLFLDANRIVWLDHSVFYRKWAVQESHTERGLIQEIVDLGRARLIEGLWVRILVSTGTSFVFRILHSRPSLFIFGLL